MGNKQSQEGRARSRLHKAAELDARCRPSGLYPSCHWEDKVIRRWIGDGKLAARLKGTEKRQVESDVECPICFLYYSEANMTKCCHGVLCTECYLQVRPQREKNSSCPFCNNPKLAISIKRGLTEEELQQRRVEEERVSQLRRQPKHQEQARPLPTPESPFIEGSESHPQPLSFDNLDESDDEDISALSSMHGKASPKFGSSLEQNERVLLMKTRSESISSEGRNTPPMEAMALSADERRELEAEMKAQDSHPLAQRLKMEESERQMNNEMEYYRNLMEERARRPNVVRLGDGRSRSQRDWNRIVSSFGTDRGGNNLDDMVFEAARMLSMEDEDGRRNRGGASRSRRGRGGGSGPRHTTNASDLYLTGMSEEEQLAMAIAASMEGTNEGETAEEASNAAAASSEAQRSQESSTVDVAAVPAAVDSAALALSPAGIDQQHQVEPDNVAVSLNHDVSTNEDRSPALCDEDSKKPALMSPISLPMDEADGIRPEIQLPMRDKLDGGLKREIQDGRISGNSAEASS